MPGRSFSNEQPRYVVPDLRVKVQEGEFVIVLNDEDIPVLGVNSFFESIATLERAGFRRIARLENHWFNQDYLLWECVPG